MQRDSQRWREMQRDAESYREILPAAVRCDMVLHQAFRARHVRKIGIGGEVRHGVTSSVSCETSLNKHVTPSPPQGVQRDIERAQMAEEGARPVILPASWGWSFVMAGKSFSPIICFCTAGGAWGNQKRVLLFVCYWFKLC